MIWYSISVSHKHLKAGGQQSHYNIINVASAVVSSYLLQMYVIFSCCLYVRRVHIPTLPKSELWSDRDVVDDVD